METMLRYNQNNPFLFAERGGLEGENKYKRGGFLAKVSQKAKQGLALEPIGANFAPNPKAGQLLHAGSPLSSRLHASAYDLPAKLNYQEKTVFPYSKSGMTENFLWDGLALIHRGTTSFINEPYVTGGNPILSTNDGVMFNDMLGNTIATKNDTLNKINMTAFGETDNKSAFFTGKPNIGELGYPDGWNNLAYVNNSVTSKFDSLGLLEVSGNSYIEEFVTKNQLKILSDWVPIGNPIFGAGAWHQEYRKGIVTYDWVEEYVMTPYYDSVWKQITEATTIAVGTIIGSTIGLSLGSVVPGPGNVVGVAVGGAAGAVISYFICESISATPTRTIKGDSPINSFRRNEYYDYYVKFERLE